MSECAQCGDDFEPTSKVNKYCSQQCRWDHTNGRPGEYTRRRKDTGFAWDPVRPARKVDVCSKKMAPRGHEPITARWKTAVILPDPQIGYRRLADGTLDPFHDARALDIAMQVVMAESPDLTIWLGDYLDFAPFGRFRLEETFAQTVQPALEKAHEYMAITASLSGEVRLLEGNHDARLQNYITDNALSAAGLRRAKAAPGDWPVLSVPYLLRLDDLNVEYVGGYPSGATYLNDNLAAIHGTVVGPAGMTVAKVVAQEQVSVIQGHIHRIETAHMTRNGRGKPKFNMAHSPGCLCRIDGAVPSTKSAVALRTGRAVKSWENWQQGLTVVRYQDSGDQRFSLEHIPIFEGWATHRGAEFRSELATNAG